MVNVNGSDFLNFVNCLALELCMVELVSVSACYVAVGTIVLSRHGCFHTTFLDFLGSRRMETAPTFIEVLLLPTLVQSDEPFDLRGSLSPTTRHRCCACMS